MNVVAVIYLALRFAVVVGLLILFAVGVSFGWVLRGEHDLHRRRNGRKPRRPQEWPPW